MPSASLRVLLVILAAGGCSSRDPARAPLADAGSSTDLRSDRTLSGSDLGTLDGYGIPVPSGVRLLGDRCVVTREVYLEWARQTGILGNPCLPSSRELLARAEASCASGSSSPDVFRCNGNLSFPFILDHLGVGTICTYDGATGEFLGARLFMEGGAPFCPDHRDLETEPVVEHCHQWPPSGPGYCGPGVYGQPAQQSPTRPVTFTLRNTSGSEIGLPDPDGSRPWSILTDGSAIALEDPGVCECPNHHCIINGGRTDRGLLRLAAGQEVSWSWDGRVATPVVTNAKLRCEQLALAPSGPLIVRVRYNAIGGEKMAEAAFDNPTTQAVIITAR